MVVPGMKDGKSKSRRLEVSFHGGKEAEKAGGGAAPNDQMWFHIPKEQSWRIIWMQVAPWLSRAQGSLGDCGFGDNARRVGTLSPGLRGDMG